MYDHIRIINPESLKKTLEDVQCGKSEIGHLNSEDFEIVQTDTKPLAGFEIPKEFPNCCSKHKKQFQLGFEKLNKFPDCCEAHQKLKSKKWFNKANYSYLPLKFVSTLAYTWDCIQKCIESPEWYKKITDYIDYTKISYGQFPNGYGSPLGLGLYLHYLKKGIENEKEIEDFKKGKLLEYIAAYFGPASKTPNTDLNLLIGIYRKWLKFFPFDLYFFTHLKEHFESQLPILEGKGETNIYTGFTGFNIKTTKAFIEFLISITETIITEINTLALYEKGHITDIQKTNIDVINSSRRLSLKEIKDKPAPEGRQYIKVLKKWFSDEKKYLNELTTALMKNIPKQSQKKSTQENAHLTGPTVALFCHLVNESGLISRKPNETVFNYCKKVCEKYNLPFTDKVRQGFSTSRNNRNVSKVIKLILPNLDTHSRQVIISYIETKQPTKESLYG